MKHQITMLLLFFYLVGFSQTDNEAKLFYRKAFEEQLLMLQGKKTIDFKRAVFVVENAFQKKTHVGLKIKF